MKQILQQTDPYTGLQTEWRGDGKRLIEVVTAHADVTRKVLDSNTKLRNEPMYAKRGIKNDMQHAARVPAEVWVQWANEGFDIFTAHPREILKKLRDRDYERLRVTSGRI